MRRVAPVLGFLLLSGCGPSAQDGTPSDPGDRIACSLGQGAAFREDCVLERVGGTLVVRHPDGGFRRFTITSTGIAEADGAQAIETRQDGQMLEVTIGADRYRIPALPQGDPKP